MFLSPLRGPLFPQCISALRIVHLIYNHFSFGAVTHISAYSWLYAQGPLWAELGGGPLVTGTRPGSVMGKASKYLNLLYLSGPTAPVLSLMACYIIDFNCKLCMNIGSL